MRVAIIALFVTCTVATAHGAPATQPNPTADGYHGIWFELGQKSEHGDKYSGGLATYTTSHVPIAIHAPKVNRTYFVYGGTIPGKRHLLAMVSYYDHATGTFPRPTIVHDKQTVDDPHDNPSLAIDDKGHIWVVVAGRGNVRPGFKYRSAQAWDISRFELVETMDRMAYPQPWWIDGQGMLFLFTKYTKGRELYWQTSVDGKTWGEHRQLAGFGGHYQTTAARSDRIVSAFNYHPGGNVDKRTNLYVVRSDDFGKTWSTAAGNVLKTPIAEKNNPAMVHDYEAEGKLVYIQDVAIDEAGNPVVLYVVSPDFRPGPTPSPRTWYTARWSAATKSWDIRPVTTSTHNYDVGALYLESADQWRIIGPSDAGPQKWGTGGEMVMWTSNDQGKTWTRSRTLTANSPRNHAYARRPVNARDDFYAIWADGDADKFSESRLYFCNKAGDVFQLPISIEGATAKPAAVSSPR